MRVSPLYDVFHVSSLINVPSSAYTVRDTEVLAGRAALLLDDLSTDRERLVLDALDRNRARDLHRALGALDAPAFTAVDRDGDAVRLGEALHEHPLIRVVHEPEIE